MTEREFQTIYAHFFPHGNCKNYTSFLFRLLDRRKRMYFTFEVIGSHLNARITNLFKKKKRTVRICVPSSIERSIGSGLLRTKDTSRLACGWSRDQLDLSISSASYEKHLLSSSSRLYWRRIISKPYRSWFVEVSKRNSIGSFASTTLTIRAN